MPIPNFLNVKLKCPHCRIIQWYVNSQHRFIICDYCSHDIDKDVQANIVELK